MSDKAAIQELQQRWLQATMAGDLATIAELMTDDVVFLTPGRPSFGKEEFLASSRTMSERVSLECAGDFASITVCGDLAVGHARLEVRVTPRQSGPTRVMSGSALTVFRRCADGQWRIAQDANLLAPKPD